jgi:hypothetical protein
MSSAHVPADSVHGGLTPSAPRGLAGVRSVKKYRSSIGWLLLFIFGGLSAWIYLPGDRSIASIERVGGTVQRLTAGERTGEFAVTLPDTVGDEDLAEMTALDRLRPAFLQLRGRQISGRGLASLTRLDCLYGLVLYGATLRDDDLTHLHKFPDLAIVNLDCNLITDGGLKHFSAKEMPKLQSLSLRGNPITAKGVDKLKAERPNVIVYSQHEPPDD